AGPITGLSVDQRHLEGVSITSTGGGTGNAGSATASHTVQTLHTTATGGTFTLSVHRGQGAITTATEVGNDVTITTAAPHRLVVGQRVAISDVTLADYNGTYVVTATPSDTTFRYTSTKANLAASSGGTVAAVSTTEAIRFDAYASEVQA